MARKVNATGRSKSGPRFTLLYHYLQDSAAWLDCTPAERAVYLEIAKLYNGSNNGTLGLSTRTAAERCKINRETAGNAFRGLMAHGLIECATPGGFDRKTRHAPEWRLTCERCDLTGAIPTKPFMRWPRVAPESSHSDLEHGPEIVRTRAPKSGHSTAPTPSSGRNEGPVNGVSAAASGRNEGPHIQSSHGRVSSAEGECCAAIDCGAGAHPTRIPPAWFADELDREHGRARGLSDDELDTQEDAFRRHYVASGELSGDWRAEWGSWCEEHSP